MRRYSRIKGSSSYYFIWEISMNASNICLEDTDYIYVYSIVVYLQMSAFLLELLVILVVSQCGFVTQKGDVCTPWSSGS